MGDTRHVPMVASCVPLALMDVAAGTVAALAQVPYLPARTAAEVSQIAVRPTAVAKPGSTDDDRPGKNSGFFCYRVSTLGG